MDQDKVVAEFNLSDFEGGISFNHDGYNIYIEAYKWKEYHGAGPQYWLLWPLTTPHRFQLVEGSAGRWQTGLYRMEYTFTRPPMDYFDFSKGYYLRVVNNNGTNYYVANDNRIHYSYAEAVKDYPIPFEA